MTDRMTFRTFPTAFKLAAIKRLEAGEAVLPLARELGVSRKLLHDWRKAWGLHGPAGLNRKRGPKPGPRKLRPLAKPAAISLKMTVRYLCIPGGRHHTPIGSILASTKAPVSAVCRAALLDDAGHYPFTHRPCQMKSPPGSSRIDFSAITIAVN